MSDVLPNGSFTRSRARAADQVTDDLRAQILSGTLTKGTRLPSEKELAAHYNVSAPTIRESLNALSATRLIEVRHGTGSFVIAETAALLASAMAAVVQLERIDIISILDVSEALYVKAVALGAAGQANESHLRVLDAADTALAAAENGPEFAVALTAFLEALVAASGNALLIGISKFLIDTQVSLAQDAVRRSPDLRLRIAGGLIDERHAIVRAIAAQDSDSAQQAVLTYTGRARELLHENLDEANF